MRSTHHQALPIVLAGTLAGIAGLAAVNDASANIILNIASLDQFTYAVNQMPDFDQRRTQASGVPGLPGGGDMYCAPTAACNVLSYVQAHGYPQIMPVLDQPYSGWLDYSSGDYLLSTIGLTLMGLAMDTDPVDGTGGQGFKDGVEAWFPADKFCLMYVYASGNSAPTAKDLALAAAGGVSGSLVLPTIGWYSKPSGSTLVRNGGHVVTLQKAQVNGSSVKLCFRDPWSNDSNLSQSSFVSQCYPTQNQGVVVGGKSRTMSKIVDYGSGWIDGYMLIRPIFGLTVTPTLTSLKLVKPVLWEFQQQGPPIQLPTGDGLAIKDLALSMNLAKVFYATKPAGAGGKIWQVTPGIAGSTAILDVLNPTKITTGTDGKLYVLDGTRIIRCHDLDTGASVQYVAPWDLADIDFDDLTRTVMGFSPQAKSLLRVTFGATGATGTPISWPAMPAFDPATASLCMDKVNGFAWLCAENINAIHGVFQTAAGGLLTQAIVHPQLIKPRGVNRDEAGRVIVACDGSVKVFVEIGGGWQPDPTQPFFGEPAPGGLLLIATSRTNFDPLEHTGPGWNNVLPTSIGPDVPDCGADLNLDDLVDGTDLGVLLAQWGSDGIADLNDDDVVDGGDLGMLLSAWGGCL